MKRYIMLSVLLLSLLEVRAQRQEEIARFVILESNFNGTDITDWSIANGNYFVFYVDEGELFLANVTNNNQSYGRISSFTETRHKETYETYAADIFKFRWRYINTYDSKRGSAVMELIKIYKPQAVAFELKMIVENMDIFIYKGYMEGSLDFDDYFD